MSDIRKYLFTVMLHILAFLFYKLFNFNLNLMLYCYKITKPFINKKLYLEFQNCKPHII